MTQNSEILKDKDQIKDVSAVYDCFRLAITEMEVVDQMWRQHELKDFYSALRHSAAYLSKSLLLSRGLYSKGVAIDEQLRQAGDSGQLNPAIISSLLDITIFEIGSMPDRNKLKSLYQKQQSNLIAARKMIAEELNFDDDFQRKMKSLFCTRQGYKKMAVVVLPVIFFLIISTAIHRYIDPIADYEVEGQLFWKSAPDESFGNEKTERFNVVIDNKVRTYTLDFKEPANIFMFRIDPVNKSGLTEIEINNVRFYDQSNTLTRELIFDGNMYWLCTNCTPGKSKSSSYLLYPENRDPYLTSSKINQDNVSRITISMRAVAKKSFWEWLLNIDKSMVF